jgi:hypothetical protein
MPISTNMKPSPIGAKYIVPSVARPADVCRSEGRLGTIMVANTSASDSATITTIVTLAMFPGVDLDPDALEGISSIGSARISPSQSESTAYLRVHPR